MVTKNRPQESSNKGLTYEASPTVHPHFPGLVEDERIYSNLIFETEIHTPQKVIPISFPDNVFVDDCLDMPIRLTGEEKYAIPENWAVLWGDLQKIIDIEHSHNPHWRDYYTYLSVEHTDNLKVGEQQRRGGAHTDGFQGARNPVKTKGSRSYVAVTNGGTFYYPQHFVANLDPSRFNVFEGFDLQVNTSTREVAEEKFFYFFDAYTVHEAGAASSDGKRIFVRLTWEKKLFDRSINTVNRMLDYDWEKVDYDVRSDLVTPTIQDIEAARMLG